MDIVANDILKENESQTVEVKAVSKTSTKDEREKDNSVDRQARYLIPFVYFFYLIIFVAVITSY